METVLSRVYVQIDASGRIIRCEGGYTTPTDLTGWVQIDEGTGDRYNLCQSHYFSGLYTSDGICRWKYENGTCILRTDAEIEADRAAVPVPVVPPTNAELAAENAKLKAQISAQSDQMDFYEDCIAEMAAVVYV